MSTPANAPGVALTKTDGARRVGIIVAVVVGGLVALNLLAGGIDRAVGGTEPSGVTGSAYGTQADGLGALASLVAHYGHDVSEERGSLANAELDPADTVFVIEPQTLTDDDDITLLDFASEGGRLVIGGSSPFYLHRLRDHPPVWSPDGTATYDDVDPQLGNVREIDTAAKGSWTSAGSGVVLVRNGDTALLTEDNVGRGAIYFLADASPLENSELAVADNAAFALGLAGDPSRPVEFVEGVHGYGESRGLGALPTPWKVALIVFAASALVLAGSRSRRFGPPDRPFREFVPARAEYVRALAVSLERTHDPASALASMQQWARSRIAVRAHLPPDASPEAVDRAAITLGFTESERAAIWHPPTDDDTALALGQLVSRLSQHDGRTK